MLTRSQADIFPVRCHCHGNGVPTAEAIHEMAEKLKALIAKNAFLCTKYENLKTSRQRKENPRKLASDARFLPKSNNDIIGTELLR